MAGRDLPAENVGGGGAPQRIVSDGLGMLAPLGAAPVQQNVGEGARRLAPIGGAPPQRTVGDGLGLLAPFGAAPVQQNVGGAPMLAPLDVAPLQENAGGGAAPQQEYVWDIEGGLQGGSLLRSEVGPFFKYFS